MGPAWLGKPGMGRQGDREAETGQPERWGAVENIWVSGRPFPLHPCSPELRPLSCSRPPDSRLRSPSCWPRSQMSPGKAS